jgi:deoxycytidylate deaminase
MSKYPYLPEGRVIHHVAADHPFMLEAKNVRAELSGDPIWPNGAVMVKEGKIVARAGNGFNRGSHLIHVCPRIVHECPSGEGYDLCSLHDPQGHAEQMTIKVAIENGIDPTGADIYMYGHWWCCKPCWDEMIAHGIANVYLPERADAIFTKELVTGPYLVPSIKSAYVACAIKHVPVEARDAYHKTLDVIGLVCESIGCTPYHPHKVSTPELMPDRDVAFIHNLGCEQVAKHEIVIAEASYPSPGVGGELQEAKHLGKSVVLVSRKGAEVSEFLRGNSAIVYHLEYDDLRTLARQLRNVLIQL